MADINLGVGGANSASDAYEIANSLKFEADNTEYITHTSSSGSGTKVTYSFWCKRTELDSSSYMQVAGITTNSETLRFMFYQDSVRVEVGNGGTQTLLVTNRKFRDTSAWYHFFIVVDTTLSTAGDRRQLWVNGVRETSFSTETYPTQNFSAATDQNNAKWRYGAYDSTYYKFSGYLAECYRLDGIAATYTDFGEFDTNGIWIPKEYTGSFGTNGHYLDFEDSSSLGADDSGNSNNFTLNNIAAADQATDTPTNNFAVLNGLHNVPDTTRKEGLTTTVKNNNGWRTLVSTLGVSSGKWYFELSAGSEYTMIGVSGDGVYGGGISYEYYVGSLTGSLGYYGNSATFFQDGVDKSPTNVASFVADDIVGLALDVDNGKAYFHKNGTYQNSANPNTSSNGYTITGDAPYFLTMSTYQQADQCEVNYGGYHVYSISSGNSDANGYGNFEYAPPSGYYALCSKNLAEYG